MFRCIVDDPTKFKNCMNSLASILDEGYLYIDENGLTMVEFDRAVACALDFQFNKAECSVYELEKPLKLGIPMRYFMSFLNRINGKLEIQATKETIVLIGLDENKKYSQNLISVKKGTPKPNKYTGYTFSTKLNVASVLDSITDMKLINDEVRFLASPTGLKIHTESKFNKYEKIVEGKSEKPTFGRYNSDFVEKFLKANVTEDVMFHMAHNDPCKLVFDTPTIKFSIMIAPRVATDTDD